MRVEGWDVIHWSREARDYLASDGVLCPDTGRSRLV
jgi:hypothetical protein